MAFLVDAYAEDEAPNAKGGVDKRTVLRLDPRLAPVKAAVLPLSRHADLVAQGPGPGRRAAQVLERRVRRRRRDRPALPPPGRDRHAVLRDGRLRHARGPRGHHPRARRDDAGAHRHRRGGRLPGDPARKARTGRRRRASRRPRSPATRRRCVDRPAAATAAEPAATHAAAQDVAEDDAADHRAHVRRTANAASSDSCRPAARPARRCWPAAGPATASSDAPLAWAMASVRLDFFLACAASS